MRVAVTGAGGLIGTRLVGALSARGDEVVTLSRSGGDGSVHWEPASEPAPAQALASVDAVVHLAGENIAQRWSAGARERIHTSRAAGTANLVAGIAGARGAVGSDPRPRVLVCANAVGYYGNRGDELLSESSGPGDDWLASVCVEWEAAAIAAVALGLRVCVLRTGVVLDRDGGALGKMLPPFQAGVGGPVAGGRQYISWIHADDLIALYLAAIDDERFKGPVNAVAPHAVRNADFSKALGRALHRPAFAPVPRAALTLLYGDMASIVTDSQNVEPARATELGMSYAHAELDEALRDALSR
ncbi:MAG TPA: TIGR01777 family oxidoreductase [Solirubrobacteraceae bacterium]|nr:TIGR01777 family oxidoreductase [Solirubrobacteraceae bacterium]